MDKKLIAEARARLYSGVISDVLDGLGNMDHAMAPNRAPARREPRSCSAARVPDSTCRVYQVEPGDNPYELEIALVDDLEARRRRGVRLPAPPTGSRPGASC